MSSTSLLSGFVARRASGLSSRFTSALTTAALVATGLVATTVAAPAAVADVSPVVNTTASTVTADALPTVQIDGVAWTQKVLGNTVYVGGQFTNARPAGAAAGTNLTSRNNLLSYNLTTGALNTAWNPNLNAQVYAIAVSPDGSRVYVGGNFTKVGTVTRNRIAAFNTTTGALITSFNAGVDYTVKSIVATNSTVYVGGAFSSANGSPRARLAAFSSATGAVLAWNPAADATVNAMTLTPDQLSLIVGGAFQNINSSAAYGMGKVDASSGALQTWNATNQVRNAGASAAILSLSTDGTSIFGTGYTYGPGTLEGTFSADPATGNLNWVEDCHGDTYDHFVTNGLVYTVSHAHYCGNIGGFFQSSPWSINMRHALAFTSTATGTVAHDPLGYHDWYGNSSPSLVNWFPDLAVGTYTGKSQAAWSVAGNSEYIVLGGEFPSVNGVGQQGLVRFAVPSLAPKKSGPEFKGAAFNPSIIALPTGARVAWQANSDMDDRSLTYKVTRDGAQVYTTVADSSFWLRPTMGFIDAGLVPGQTYKYRLSATDLAGNVALSENIEFTASAAAASSTYATRVLADGAAPYWPLNEASGTTLFDNGGFNDADAGAGIVRGTLPGAISGDAASSFDGATSSSTRTAIDGPNTYTLQAWINTTSTTGGKIIGFGSNNSGFSGSYDRQVYMDNDGHVWYGVYPNGVATLNSTGTYNDGQWHQITATLGADGMKLYIDAKLISQRSDVTWGQGYSGYWRVGGDNLNGWPGQPANFDFVGAIDEVAIYPTVLTRQAIDAQWVASGRTSTIPVAPADAYGAAIFNDNPLLFWRLGETRGALAADASPNGDQTGIYQPGNPGQSVTLGATGGVRGTTNTAATFDGSDDFVASSNSYANPMNYSVEAWFKTTSTSGGKIIGFGCGQTGTSGCYDRHIYMSNDGKVTFGVWTGFTNTITASTPLNDGQWHHVVATQSNVTGMKLYVDGALAGTNGQTSAQDYSGFWRVGGDNHWGCCSPFLAATIDEAAVYGSVLTPSQVSNHFNLGNTNVPANRLPVAEFSSSAVYLDATFDASASSDPDGTITGMAWNFGDGGTGTRATPTHTYAAAGTYTVTLTVTDNSGDTTVITHPITVTAPPVNQPPAATFAVSASVLTASVDASASTDSDGTITAYNWAFGDGATATGVTASHSYTAAGTYTITLVATDDDGATNTTTQSVTVTAPVNVAPTASFSATADQLTVSVNGTGSSDTDGTVAGYAWDFGDGATATGPTASHTYTTAGIKTITLTVTDNKGATNSSAQPIEVIAPPANVPPTAAFTVGTAGLTANVQSTSTDTDGSIVAYQWSFGDTGSATTAAAAHTYAAAGSYPVTLTVTDNNGASASLTQTVTVTAPEATPLVADLFGRTAASGWGNADTGGAWTVSGGASNFSINGGTGKVRLTAAGAGPSASLGTVSSANVRLAMDVTLDKASTGGGTYVSLAARKVGTSEYRTTVKLLATGVVQLQIIKITSGVSSTLRTVTVAGLSYAAGDTVTVAFDVSGSTSVALNAKVWKTGTTEPAAWQASATDATATLAAAGGVALYPYLSASSTNAPVVASFDNLKVFATQP